MKLHQRLGGRGASSGIAHFLLTRGRETRVGFVSGEISRRRDRALTFVNELKSLTRAASRRSTSRSQVTALLPDVRLALYHRVGKQIAARAEPLVEGRNRERHSAGRRSAVNAAFIRRSALSAAQRNAALARVFMKSRTSP
ncbi:MAG TPA: hypothetical protein VMU85_06315, partial [Stellaceae bacterium]|nr:hypothetical protein [Stellaceae bacterium]